MKQHFVKAAFWAFCSFNAPVAYAQSMFAPNVAMPQPFSSFNNNVSEEVNLHTGAVNVTVPLYTVEGTTLRLPVSLSYSTSGIKVGERAGWAGLGWELNAGGYVVVEQKGENDESFDGYTGTTPSDGYRFNINEDLLTQQSPQYYYYFDGFDWIQWGSSGPANYVRRNSLALMYSREIDGEPDIYHFSFGGYSGKFVFDYYGVPHMIPHQNIYVTRQSSGLTFLTPDGTTYIFNVSESIKDYSDAGRTKQTNNYVSKFYLSQVVSATKNDVISLSYITLPDLNYESHTQRRYDFGGGAGTGVLPSQMTLHIASDALQDVGVGQAQDIPTYSILSGPKRLSSITSAKCVLQFNPATGRLDVPGDRMLAGIQRQGYAGGNIVDSYTFQYIFSNSSSNNNPDCMRMLLSSITQSGNGASKNPYSFSYQNTVGSTTVNMPSLFSPQMDMWGYYNGAISNSNAVPSTTYNGVTYSGADRSVNAAYAQIGLLNKVTYPMGGSTSFTYEGNTYLDPATNTNMPTGGLRLLQRQDNDGNGNTTVKNYSYVLEEDATKSSGSIDQVPVFFSRLHVNVPIGYDVANTSATSISLLSPIVDYYFTETYSDPVVEYGVTQGSHVGYSCVKVSEVGKGWTRYKFSSFLDAYGNHPDDVNTVVNDCDQTVNEIDQTVGGMTPDPTHMSTAGPTTCYLPRTSREAERGLLWSVSYYNESNALQKKVNSLYSFQEVQHSYVTTNATIMDPIMRVPAVRSRVNYNLYSYTAPNQGKLCLPNLYIQAPYSQNTGGGMPNFGYWGMFRYLSEWVKLTQSIEEVYDQSAPYQNKTTSTTDYEYSAGSFMVSKISQSNSDGKKIVTAYTYPFDYSNLSTGTIPAMQSNFILSPVIEKVVYEITPTGTYILSGQLNYYTGTGILASTYTLENTTANPIPLNSFKFSNNSVGLLPPCSTLIPFDYSYIDPEFASDGESPPTFPQQSYAPDPRYMWRNVYQYDSKDNLIMSTAILNGTTYGPTNSVIWDYAQAYPIAQVANSSSDKVAYTSFEFGPGVASNWRFNTSFLNVSDAKTGGSCYYGASQILYPLTFPNGNYRVSFWAKYTGTTSGPSVTVASATAGSPVTIPLMGSGWNYYETVLPGSINGFIISPFFGASSEKVYLDELRICPTDAQMVTYTYIPLVGVSSKTDANGITTYYEPDLYNNHPAIIRDQNGHILKKVTTHYKH